MQDIYQQRREKTPVCGYRQRGFSLVEILLYVSIAGVMLALFTVFYSQILSARVNNTAVLEVEGQGRHAAQVITQAIRNAEDINTPAAGGSGSTLSLDVPAAADSPTVFDISSGVLRITEGGGSAIPLTNDRVEISNVVFENLSRADTPGVIRVSFTLSFKNPEGRREYSVERTFYATGALRQM